MNIFNNLKETLSNATKDFTSNFQPKHGSKSGEKVAGHELLMKYIQNWKEICINTDSMGKQAEVCDRLLAKLFNNVVHSKAVVDGVASELNCVEKILHNVEMINLRLVDVDKSCKVVENSLMELEMLNVQCQHYAMKELIEKNFNIQQAKKIENLEHTKKLLHEKHKKNVEKMKTEESKKRVERQKVFDDAHKQQMESYRIFGQVTHKFEQANNCLPSVDISEITLDDEESKNKLEEFLESFKEEQENLCNTEGSGYRFLSGDLDDNSTATNLEIILPRGGASVVNSNLHIRDSNEHLSSAISCERILDEIISAVTEPTKSSPLAESQLLKETDLDSNSYPTG